MPKRYSRIERIADQIQIALAEIIQYEMNDMGGETKLGMITITDVKVSPDLSHAKVYVSILEDEKATETIHRLNEASKSIRYALAHAVDLRMTPDLKFFYDDSTVRGSHISSLINNALKDKK